MIPPSKQFGNFLCRIVLSLNCISYLYTIWQYSLLIFFAYQRIFGVGYTPRLRGACSPGRRARYRCWQVWLHWANRKKVGEILLSNSGFSNGSDLSHIYTSSANAFPGTNNIKLFLSVMYYRKQINYVNN